MQMISNKNVSIFLCFLFLSFAVQSQVMMAPTLPMQDSMEAMQKILTYNIKNKGTPSNFSSLKIPKYNEYLNGYYQKKQPSSICSDTAARFFWQNDSISYGLNHPYKTQNGELVLTGYFQRAFPPYKNGSIVLRTDLNGNVVWGKKFDSSNSVNNHSSDYYRALELNGGDLILVGRTNNRVSGNQDLVITKTNSSGNIIWSKTYKSRLWGTGSGSADYFYVQQIKQDPSSGDVYFTGPFWSDGRALVRLNPNNGIIIWSRAYNSGSSFDNSFGIDIRPQEIRLFGRTINSLQTKSDISIYKISKINGDTINTRFFTTNDTNGSKTNFLSLEPLVVTNDGHYLVAGRPYGSFQYMWNGTTPFFQGSVAEFDSSLNFVKAYCFKNYIESNGYNTRITTFPDKTGVFSMLSYISSYSANVYLSHFADSNIIKQRRRYYSGEGISYEPLAAQLPNGGTMTVKLLGDSAANLNKIEFLKTFPSDTSSACLGYNDNSTFIYSFAYVPPSFNEAGMVKSNVFEESANKTFVSFPIIPQLGPACFQISHCDTIKVLSSVSVICQSQPLNIIVRKNFGCGSRISWQYPNNTVNNIIQQNDSSFLFYFSNTWSGYIYGSIQGCSLLKDSIFISVLQAPISLDLGPDTSICPSNAILLNAHQGYSTYLWQNGSTDSILVVTAPGTYFVKTTDACGGIFRDTVIVSPRTTQPISIGIDRQKCNNDTIQLSIPGNFISYQWLPNYNISSTVAQMVTVNPSVDTTYFARAEKTPGCFSYDTVHITVNHSPIINLGIDTSICFGQTLTLNAGAGFINYLWSNGVITQQLPVNTVGTYHVIATTADNCTSKDSITLKRIFALPLVKINHGNELCLGTSRILDGGSFAGYLWQDNSTLRTFTVSNLGTYYVTITDSNNCKASDTARFTTLLNVPKNFLPRDTSICDYGTINLTPSSIFLNYLWNNGTTNANLAIEKAGIYWLEVKDSKGCMGKDSIQVFPKQCLNGLFVPNAFTPNGNGKNDVLKAMLFGNVKSILFSVYNKYGELLFRTTDVNMGWNGVFKGVPQVQGTYIWTCSYILDGKPMTIEKGTVILIR